MHAPAGVCVRVYNVESGGVEDPTGIGRRILFLLLIWFIPILESVCVYTAQIPIL